MFRNLLGACVGLAMMGMAGTANASVMINPMFGMFGTFQWNAGITGTGLSIPLTGIDSSDFSSVDGDEFWEITLSIPGTIDIGIDDDFMPGDGFSLLLDGSMLVATTQVGGGGPGGTLFSAFYDDVLLSAGTNRFDLTVVDSCCIGPGQGNYSFSSVTPTAAPEPFTALLFATGLAGLGFMGWRRRRTL